MELKVASITEEKQNVNKIEFENGKVLYLIGTAHVSKESMDLVSSMIEDNEPDTVAVELDPGRLEVLKNRKRFEETDIFEIFKRKKFFSFQHNFFYQVIRKKYRKRQGLHLEPNLKKLLKWRKRGALN